LEAGDFSVDQSKDVHPEQCTPVSSRHECSRLSRVNSRSKFRCPFCDSTVVRPSSRYRFADLIQLIVLRRPVRCRGCGSRFYIWLWEKLHVPRR
jgi:hypothetical protein